jgi:hypothetical protein
VGEVEGARLGPVVFGIGDREGAIWGHEGGLARIGSLTLVSSLHWRVGSDPPRWRLYCGSAGEPILAVSAPAVRLCWPSPYLAFPALPQ